MFVKLQTNNKNETWQNKGGKVLLYMYFLRILRFLLETRRILNKQKHTGKIFMINIRINAHKKRKLSKVGSQWHDTTFFITLCQKNG